MANTEIRALCVSKGIRMWQLADAYGCSEMTLYRKLRHDLSDDDKKRFLDIIAELSAQKKNDN